MTVTIYHNQDCGTSRHTLVMIRASVTVRDLLREKGMRRSGWAMPNGVMSS